MFASAIHLGAHNHVDGGGSDSDFYRVEIIHRPELLRETMSRCRRCDLVFANTIQLGEHNHVCEIDGGGSNSVIEKILRH